MADAILVLNAGSSSLKFSVFLGGEPPQPLLRGQLEGLLSEPHFVARDAGGIAGHEVRLAEEPLELATEQGLGRLPAEEHRELEAGGAGIQDKDRVGHDVTSPETCRYAGRGPPGPSLP